MVCLACLLHMGTAATNCPTFGFKAFRKCGAKCDNQTRPGDLSGASGVRVHRMVLANCARVRPARSVLGTWCQLHNVRSRWLRHGGHTIRHVPFATAQIQRKMCKQMQQEAEGKGWEVEGCWRTSVERRMISGPNPWYSPIRPGSLCDSLSSESYTIRPSCFALCFRHHVCLLRSKLAQEPSLIVFCIYYILSIF